MKTKKKHSGLRLLLEATEAPFLFTILAALLAWTLTQIADRILESPTIEVSEIFSENENLSYRPCREESLKTELGPYVVRYRLRNISRDTLFKNLAFLVRLPEDSNARFLGARLRASPPAISSDEPEGCSSTNMATYFEGQTLHPNTEVEFVSVLSERSLTTFSLTESETAVDLKYRGLVTILVPWESFLLLLLALTTASVLIVYLFLLYNPRRIDHGN